MEPISLLQLEFSIQEDSNQYKFINPSAQLLPIGSILVDFLNLDIEWLTGIIEKYNGLDALKAIEKIHTDMTLKYNLIFATLIKNFLAENTYYIKSGGKLEDLYDDALLSLVKFYGLVFPNINQSINEIMVYTASFLNVQKSHYISTFSFMSKHDRFYETVMNSEQFLEIQNIRYKVNPQIVNKNMVLNEQFYLNDYQSFLAVEFMQIYKRNLVIKQCENCNDWFIPTTRSDEIYCDKKNSNGRSCKQIGWENKPKDEAYNVYRKAYSRVFNYVKRHKGEYQELEDFFKVWKREANYYMSLCNGDNNRINQYKSWIRQSEKKLKKIVKSDEFTLEELKEWMENNKGDNE